MKMLSEAPTVHETATLIDCTLGKWTEVYEDVSMREVEFGDYSYIVRGGNVIWSTIGKFCSIAEGARINPGNHATWRVSQHHFTYRAGMYDLARTTPSSSSGGATTGSRSDTMSGSATAPRSWPV